MKVLLMGIVVLYCNKLFCCVLLLCSVVLCVRDWGSSHRLKRSPFSVLTLYKYYTIVDFKFDFE